MARIFFGSGGRGEQGELGGRKEGGAGDVVVREGSGRCGRKGGERARVLERFWR